MLAFSRGGTRAAAFSYGVLDALRNEKLIINGQPARLLDQVDVISGFDTLLASFDAASNTLTTENITRARQEFLAWGADLNQRRAKGQPPVEVYFTTLTFDQIAAPDRLAKYNAMPAATLSTEQVEELIALPSELLRQSPAYNKLLRDIRGF